MIVCNFTGEFLNSYLIPSVYFSMDFLNLHVEQEDLIVLTSDTVAVEGAEATEANEESVPVS